MVVPSPAVVAAERLCTRLTTRLLDGEGVAHVHAYRDAAPAMRAVGHARVTGALLLAVPRIDRFGGSALARAATERSGSGGLQVRVQLTRESDQREFRIRLAEVYALGAARLLDDGAARERARRVGGDLAVAVGHGGCALLEVQVDAVVLHGPVGGRHYRLRALPERDTSAESAEATESAGSGGSAESARATARSIWPGRTGREGLTGRTSRTGWTSRAGQTGGTSRAGWTGRVDRTSGARSGGRPDSDWDALAATEAAQGVGEWLLGHLSGGVAAEVLTGFRRVAATQGAREEDLTDRVLLLDVDPHGMLLLDLREPVPHSVYVAFDEPLPGADDVPAALGRLFRRTLRAPGTPDAA